MKARHEQFADTVKDEGGKESPPSKEKLELQTRLQSLIRVVSGRSDLDVTTQLSPQMQRQLTAEGKNPDEVWFRAEERDPKTREIVKEYVHIPEHIFERHENVAKGKAAHEAGHVAVTRYGEFIPDDVMKELGFGSLMSAAEERPTDQVVRERYPGAGTWVDEARRDNVLEAELYAKGKEIAGRTPKFAQLCDLIVHEPHYADIPAYYDKDVLETYERIRNDIEETEQMLPPDQADEKETVAQAKKRYKTIYKNIWPHVKQLVEDDKSAQETQELLRQMAQESAQQDNKQNQKQEDGNKENTPAEQSESGEGEQVEQEEGNKQGGEETGEQSLQDEIEKNLSGAQKEELEKAIEEIVAQGQDEGGEESGQQNPEQGSDGEAGENTPGQSEGGEPASGQISEGLREALQKAIENLSPEMQERISQEAQRTLEKVEDMIMENMQSDMVDNPDTHEKRHEQEEAAEKEEKNKEEQARIKKELEDINRKQAALAENANAYEQAYKEIREYDEELYKRLEDIFHPNAKRKTRLKTAGSRLNLPAVFKWKANKAAGAQSMDHKIFESVHHPEKMDYAITLLVDLSGSMQGGGKIEETFKGVVLLAEVLNRLGIKNEILGFQDEVIDFKHFDEQLGEREREKISGMPKEVFGDNPGGNNAPRYNDDGPCLRDASRSLEEEPAKEKILIVLSDGAPEGRRSGKEDLNKAVRHILEHTDQKLIGVGLGKSTEHVTDFYPASLPDVSVNNLTETFGDLLEDVFLNPEKYSYRS